MKIGLRSEALYHTLLRQKKSGQNQESLVGVSAEKKRIGRGGRRGFELLVKDRTGENVGLPMKDKKESLKPGAGEQSQQSARIRGLEFSNPPNLPPTHSQQKKHALPGEGMLTEKDQLDLSAILKTEKKQCRVRSPLRAGSGEAKIRAHGHLPKRGKTQNRNEDSGTRGMVPA